MADKPKKRAAPTTEFVTCPECGYEQEDMGRGVRCDECGYGPMPTKPATPRDK